MNTVLGIRVLLMLALGFWGLGYAQNLVRVEMREKILSFTPLQKAKGYELRVLGDAGVYFERAFPAVSVPFFEPFDAQGEVLPDGAYRYELRVLTSGPPEEKEKSSVLVGEFLVKAGAIAHPDPILGTAVALETYNLFPWHGGRLGMGTATPDPGTQLHLSSSDFPAIRMEHRGETLAKGLTWDLRMNQAGLLLQNRMVGKLTEPVFFSNGAPDDSFHLSPSGAIGIGTDSPTAQMDIQSTGSGDVVRLRNHANLKKRRNVLTLENHGEVAFQMVMQPTGDIWSFLVREEDFLISRNGSRAEELRITENGTLYTHGSINPKSDRAAKHNFEAVEPSQILNALKGMPIQSWVYKDDSTGARHLGPTSQDFHAAFSLGEDDGSISVLDSTGVALVAIQALEARLAAKEQEVEMLRERNDSLAQRLESLEAKMVQILEKSPLEK